MSAAPRPTPGARTDRRPPFRFSATLRVGFDETDAQGVVYYGRYLPYFDRARVEYHRDLGLLALLSSGDREVVMRASSVEYRAPARFDDLLEVFVRAARLGTSSVTWECAAYGEDGTLLGTATQTMVQIDVAARRSCPLDDGYRQALADFEGSAP